MALSGEAENLPLNDKPDSAAPEPAWEDRLHSGRGVSTSGQGLPLPNAGPSVPRSVFDLESLHAAGKLITATA